ncbi:MAG: hypothetical protein Ta2B_14140 [Termitinemataceae bacterium]|nr:MAG: hypothetical protein Ta2B_14140 [Termitinemataceae bacterium]
MKRLLIILVVLMVLAGCDTEPRYLGDLDPGDNVLQGDDLMWQPPTEPTEPSIPILNPSPDTDTPLTPPSGIDDGGGTDPIFEYIYYQLNGYAPTYTNGEWDYKKDEEFTINGKTIRYVDIYYDNGDKKNFLFSTTSSRHPYNTQLILRPTELVSQGLTKEWIDHCIQVETRIDYWGKYPFTKTYRYWNEMFKNLPDSELVFKAYALDEKTDGSEGGVEPKGEKVWYTIHIESDSCSRLYIKCYKIS